MLLKKIVVAEDDDAVAHLLSAVLGDGGFLCLRARDGEEALALTRRELPDLLVLDVMMPKMDGIEVTRRLKADVVHSRVPILMLTALASVNDKVAGLDAGADDYLAKPFDLRELAARARSLMRASKRERGRDPTTNLPGSSAVEEHVEALLRKKAACTVLHLDIDHFGAYADAFGFRRAEEVVAEFGQLVLERARAFGGGSAFVGHLGGDDFLVVLESGSADELGRDLAAAFDARLGRWYEGTSAVEQTASQMSLSAVSVDAQACGATTTDELSRVLAAARRTSSGPPTGPGAGPRR